MLEVGCGVGTLSLGLARRAGRLTGIDVVRAAVEDAAANAARAGVTNATFRTGRADHALRRLLAAGERADLVVLHAMRRPYGADVLRRVPALGARRILYLAPSAPSLAEDLTHLPAWGVRRLGFLDQLPGTAFLLTLCVLEPR